MMQVTKVWWDGEKLMAEPIDPSTIYQEPAQQKPDFWEGYVPEPDSTCNNTLRAQNKGYPRTCRKCGKGPCIADRVQPKQEPMAHTTGHCENHKQKGGCQLHNLQCGWPDCDRKPITTPPAQQEPVAWMDDDGNLHREKPHQSYGPEPRPLVFCNTSPPAQRKPLTDEQIVAKALHLSGLGTSPDVIQFARAIEAAHGIFKDEK